MSNKPIETMSQLLDEASNRDDVVGFLQYHANRKDLQLWVKLLSGTYGNLVNIELDDGQMVPNEDDELISQNTGIGYIEAGLSMIHSDNERTRDRAISLIEDGLSAFEDNDRMLMLSAFRQKNFSFIKDTFIKKAFPDFFPKDTENANV